MTGWIVNAAYAISGAMLVMMSIGIAFSAFMPALDRWSRRYFITFFSVLLIYAGIISIDMMIYDNPEMASLLRIIMILEYLCFSVLTVMPMPLLLHCCGEEQINSVLLRAEIMMWCVFCIMLLATQLCDMFYYVSSDNQYYRGPLFPLMISPLAVIMIINTAALIIKRKKISKRFFLALLIYILPTTILVILYMFAAVDLVVSFWVFLCALTMFALILTDNMKKYMHQQREIANQRANVMILQMRPHFVYNTMMGIYYLCGQDSQKAKQVTLDFTTYLRKNFTAIASEDTIPFSEELEHTRAYLAVEQVQFEDILIVDYDTPHTHFRLPSLTLQQIVENAVKYGCDPDSEPLHIVIRTRSTDSGSEITVEDNGPGYVDVDDNKPHIALANIKERLELMCGGTMSISKRERGGTVVRIIIP